MGQIARPTCLSTYLGEAAISHIFALPSSRRPRTSLPGGHDELADTATDFAASGDADAQLKRGEEGTKTGTKLEQGSHGRT